MKQVSVNMMGRLGNQMFQYAFARAYAEKHGYDLRVQPWVGNRIWNIDSAMPTRALKTVNEDAIERGEGDVSFYGYFQNQKCALYTREQLRRWFTLKIRYQELLKVLESEPLLAHRRVGDYVGVFPVIPESKFVECCDKFGLDKSKLVFVTEENPHRLGTLPADLQFLVDFYRLMNAKVLIRGNSTFSWWAATLGNNELVFAPIMKGIRVIEDITFTEGNWPATVDLGFVSDIKLE